MSSTSFCPLIPARFYHCYFASLTSLVAAHELPPFSGSRFSWTYGSVRLKLAYSFLCPLTVPVEITAGPADTTAEYLSNVSLSCTARGPPVPEFTWTVDSGSGAEDVMESEQITIATVPTGTPDEHMSILTFIDLQPSTANYTCHVNNLLGNDSSTAILNIQGKHSTFLCKIVDYNCIIAQYKCKTVSLLNVYIYQS